MTRQRTVRTYDTVRVGGDSSAGWIVLAVVNGLAHLRHTRRWPTVEWRDVPVSRLTLAEDHS